VKVAAISFSSLEARRAYQDALRERLYAAGYAPHQVTEYLRLWFPPKKLTGFVSGTDDAERAADVAGEVRGVVVKLREVP
jgi:hypothetical protein